MGFMKFDRIKIFLLLDRELIHFVTIYFQNY